MTTSRVLLVVTLKCVSLAKFKMKFKMLAPRLVSMKDRIFLAIFYSLIMITKN